GTSCIFRFARRINNVIGLGVLDLAARRRERDERRDILATGSRAPYATGPDEPVAVGVDVGAERGEVGRLPKRDEHFARDDVAAMKTFSRGWSLARRALERNGCQADCHPCGRTRERT